MINKLQEEQETLRLQVATSETQELEVLPAEPAPFDVGCSCHLPHTTHSHYHLGSRCTNYAGGYPGVHAGSRAQARAFSSAESITKSY